jgi:hypothetical protein
MNVTFGEALKNAIITVDGKTVDASQRFTMAIAPNVANQSIIFTIKIGDHTHIVPLGIDKYAKALINSETQPAEAKNLAYAMVEYVRVMTGDEDFCNVTLEGYEAQAVDTEKVYDKGENLLLSNIAFQLDKSIAIAITGTADAEGKEVHLILATGRSEWGTIKNGVVIFEGLYINEFFGDMTIEVYDVSGEGEDAVKTDLNETYTYSIENYYNAMGDSYKPAIAALYNYAFHADAYVDALPKNA